MTALLDNIREFSETDASAFRDLLQKLYLETEFTFYEPGEKIYSIEEQAEIIRKINSKKNSLIVAAFSEDRPVAYLYASGGESNRTRHSVSLAIGVLKNYWDQGYGKELCQYAENWMRKNNIFRAELLVATYNLRAINFYLKQGFEFEGLKKRASFINHRFVDMYAMSKWLG